MGASCCSVGDVRKLFYLQSSVNRLNSKLSIVYHRSDTCHYSRLAYALTKLTYGGLRVVIGTHTHKGLREKKRN